MTRATLQTWMHTNVIFKTILFFITLAIPIWIMAFLSGISSIPVFSHLWLGFYGCLLLCISYQRTWIKRIMIAANALSLFLLISAYCLSGFGAIPAILLKTVAPFIPNPWL